MKRILVVEDEDAIREFVVINLQRAGYDVVEANSGEAALQKYEENHGEFDVAILDIMMPGGGYHFAPTHAIQDNTPTENVLAMYQAAHQYGVY